MNTRGSTLPHFPAKAEGPELPGQRQESATTQWTTLPLSLLRYSSYMIDSSGCRTTYGTWLDSITSFAVSSLSARTMGIIESSD